MALAALTRARHTFAESGRKIELFYDVISPYSYVGFEVTIGKCTEQGERRPRLCPTDHPNT